MSRTNPTPTSVSLCLLQIFLVLTAPVMMAPTCGPPPLWQPPPDVRADCSNADPLRQPFFGDLHVHTTNSLDANMQGTRLGPDDAYAFAMGTTVGIQPYVDDIPQRWLTIDRPLDFAMVADHAEFLGELSICNDPSYYPAGWQSLKCQEYRSTSAQMRNWAFVTLHDRLAASPETASHHPGICGEDGQECVDDSITRWTETQQAAENAYDRSSACEFTSFVGYEWSGTTGPGVRNLHRNVVFRNTTVPTRPTSYFEAPQAESLWDALDADCADNAPCDVLTIPHNSNLSQGIYFMPTDRAGNPYTQTVAQRRQDMEPVIEVMQHKGQSECIPGSSPADELCDFEVLPCSSLAGPGLLCGGSPKPRDFVREALKEGLRKEHSLGANPFKYGMVGSTDTHLGIPGAASEDNFPGHGGAGAVGVTLGESLPPGLTDPRFFNPGGLMVVWAEENSRDSLFDAMQRREVYATSGTRPEVRFFGGFGLDPGLCSSPTMIEDAYAQSVPMGGDLPPGSPGQSPTFFVNALKDPAGVDLQRVQIIKGWLDDTCDEPDDEPPCARETIYEVDLSTGATVDPTTCQPVGTGLTQSCTVWTDPSFSEDIAAFYYVRVVENPTCRWHQYQCNAAGVDCAIPSTITEGFEGCCNGAVPYDDYEIQERAWTSPIWYTPERGCNDGIDNDGDGLIDLADPQCRNAQDPSEDPRQCSDGDDNDNDGMIDYPADPNCSDTEDNKERVRECSDGIDNDADGLPDMEDPECRHPEDPTENPVQCSDGVDNDGDMLIDMDDPQCRFKEDPSEDPRECSDGIDNDGDGQTDHPDDTGCTDKEDDTEGS